MAIGTYLPSAKTLGMIILKHFYGCINVHGIKFNQNLRLRKADD